MARAMVLAELTVGLVEELQQLMLFAFSCVFAATQHFAANNSPHRQIHCRLLCSHQQAYCITNCIALLSISALIS
jgi:hypothetical protein